MTVAPADPVAAIHLGVTIGEGGVTIGGGLRFK